MVKICSVVLRPAAATDNTIFAITSPILKGLVPILQHFPFLMNPTPVGTNTAWRNFCIVPNSKQAHIRPLFTETAFCNQWLWSTCWLLFLSYGTNIIYEPNGCLVISIKTCHLHHLAFCLLLHLTYKLWNMKYLPSQLFPYPSCKCVGSAGCSVGGNVCVQAARRQG